MHRNNNVIQAIENVTIVALESVVISLFIRVFFIFPYNGVVGGTRTPTDLSTRPSSVRVYHSATTTRIIYYSRLVAEVIFNNPLLKPDI